jgi:DNA-binding MarR family transcriptional regulator
MRLKKGIFQRQHDASGSGLSAPVSSRPSASPRVSARNPGKLSEKQAQTFLGEAARRICTEAKTRAGRWLRRLDRIHKSGCRTKQQRWDALAALAESLMSRVDLATLVLGWMDSNGQFRLNRQRRLVDDGGLTDSRVSRTLTALEEAGYVRRKQRRLYQDGKRWATRTMIHLRPRLFIDLGLGHLLAAARTRKKHERTRKLGAVRQRLQIVALQELTDHHHKQQRKRAAQAREGRVLAAHHAELSVASRRRQAVSLLELKEQYPDLSDQDILTLLRQQAS